MAQTGSHAIGAWPTNDADNTSMPVLCAQWHPVLPAHALRAGNNVLACTVVGQDLALWRSASGQVQA